MGRKYKLITILLVLAIVFIGFGKELIENNFLYILEGDNTEQYYPILLGYWQKFHDLDFNLYEWSLGLGGNMFSYCFYNILNPFNLLVLPFPKEAIKYLIFYINVLKLIVLSLFAYSWLDRIVKNKYSAVIGSLLITFSGWILFYYHYSYLDNFMLFFLVLMFAEDYLQKNKKIGLILSVFYITLQNYYFAYMLIPFLWLYSLFRYLIITNDLNAKKVIKSALVFAGYTLLGICMAGITLLPNAYLIVNSSRFTESSELSLFVGMKDLFRIVSSLFVPTGSRYNPNALIDISQTTYQGWGGGAPLFTSILAPIFLTSILFIKDKMEKFLNIGFVLLLIIFMICPYFYQLFQLNLDTRFFYMFIVYEVYVVSVAIDRDYINKKYILIFVLEVAVTAIMFFMAKRYGLSFVSDELVKYEVLIFAIGFLSLLALLKFGTKGLLVGICLELCLTTFYFVNNNPSIGYDEFNYIDSENEVLEDLKETDNSFYRTIVLKDGCYTANDSYANQVNGFEFYTSVYSVNQEELLNHLRTQDWYSANSNARSRLYTLLGAKYLVSDIGNVIVSDEYEEIDDGLYKNTNYIELGFANNKTFNADYWNALSEFEQETILLEYIVTDESNNTDCSLLQNIEPLAEYNSNGFCILEFDEPVSDAVIYIRNYAMPDVNVSAYYQEEPVAYNSFFQYGYVEYYIKKNQKVDKIVINISGGYESTFDVYINRNASKFDNEINEVRKENSFYDVEYNNDYIKGSINLDEDSYVYTYVPYDEGWHVYDNGEKIDTIKIDGGLIGLKLEEGQHTIEFKYSVPWLNYGLLLSGAFVIVFAVIVINDKMKRQ